MIEFNSIKTFKFIVLAILTLLILHTLVHISKWYFEYDYLKGVVPLFSLQKEQNVPTLFSTCLFLLSSIISLFISYDKSEKGKRKYWVGLALIMGFLAVDETAEIHEKSMYVTRSFFDTSGYLYYAWIIPWFAFAFLVFLVYIRFLLMLPRKTAFLFLLAGAVFLLGAGGLEAVEGKIDEGGGYMNKTYILAFTVQETLEMLGISILIYASINYLEKANMTIDIRIGSKG